MSLFTSLTGLNGAQAELTTISNNIANTGTVGFKRGRVEFGDIIATSPFQDPKRVVGAGTTVKAIAQQFTQGALQSSLNTLDMAVTGQGFFAVRPKPPSNEIRFTRAGAFAVDPQRFVVDSEGQHVQILPVNADGQVTSGGVDALRSLQLPASSGLPRPTTKIELALNLPSTAEVIPASPRFSVASPYRFDQNDPTTFNASTSTTIFDSLGNPLIATVYYVRTQAATASAPTSLWDAHILVGDTEVAPASGGTLSLTFDNSGRLASPATAIAFAPFTPAAGGNPQVFTVNHRPATSQLADPFNILSATQDGFASGRLDSVSVDTGGLVKASFTNGQVVALGKIALVSFASPVGLRQIGGALYGVTGASGEPQVGEAGIGGFGTILSGSLERSNVDITEELVGLITAQRNFQANAKAIETGNTMIQAIIGLRS